MVALSRRTITGLITTSGRLFDDWTADYRLLSKARFDPEPLWAVVRRGILRRLPEGRPLVVAMDDTTTRKRGRRIPGTAWRRDPLGPPFATNFIWGRRFLQFSAILPPDEAEAPSRAIPIALHHAPSATKPSRKAPPEAWTAYHQARRTQTLPRQAAEQLRVLRTQVDQDGAGDRRLWVVADGGYTNKTVLRSLPEHTTFIGRLREDALLALPPPPPEPRGRGRRPAYGPVLPTPEQLRHDDGIPWSTALVFVAGKLHRMSYKTVGPVLWRAAGAQRPLRLVVVAPLAYRLSARSKLLYRRPAYLICTDPTLSPEEILAAYVSRWDIEVNFRDEKSLLGLDEAQVRTPASARLAPTLAVAAYALLLLASTQAFGLHGVPATLPLPKWRLSDPPIRATTAQLMNHLRFELWAPAMKTENFSDFVAPSPPSTKPEKFLPPLSSALFYAQSAY